LADLSKDISLTAIGKILGFPFVYYVADEILLIVKAKRVILKD
jgi:hypothetical protein